MPPAARNRDLPRFVASRWPPPVERAAAHQLLALRRASCRAVGEAAGIRRAGPDVHTSVPPPIDRQVLVPVACNRCSPYPQLGQPIRSRATAAVRRDQSAISIRDGDAEIRRRQHLLGLHHLLDPAGWSLGTEAALKSAILAARNRG
jgi:hypothetical protein